MFSVLLIAALAAGTSAQYVVSPSWLGGHSTIVSLTHPGLITPYFAAPPAVSTVIPVKTSSQFHAQDELGQFAFGHSTDTQARTEVKSLDGTVRGAYSYIDPNNKLINVQYLADANGFRVLGANNLPVAPEAVLEPVKDTVEVVEARAAFAKKFKEAEEEALKSHEEVKSRSRRDVLLTSIVPTVAKTTLKTSEFTPIEGLKTPAATKLADWKETEREILTPVLSHQVISPVIVKSEIKPIETKIITKTIPDVGLITSPLITSRIVSPLSWVGKTIIKEKELKPIEDAKVPAATRLAEIKEIEKEILTPWIYDTPVLRSGLWW